jgi:hypothetical protein
MLVTSEYFDSQVIAGANGGAGITPLTGNKLHLYTNSVSPTKTNVPADFVEPTYTGYAAASLTWGSPSRDPSGNISTDTGLEVFQMSNALTPTTIIGYYITDTAGTHFLMGEMFATPQQLVDTLSILAFVIEFIQSSPSPGGATLVP